MPTRLHLFKPPGDSPHMVITQVRLPNGDWSNQSVRPATEEEIVELSKTDTRPMPEKPAKKPVAPENVKYFEDEVPEPAAPEPQPAPAAPSESSGSSNVHARLAPSASKQWTACTASLAFIEANQHRVSKDDGSVWASEGTEAHDWAADVLLGKIDLSQVPDGKDVRSEKFPDADFRTPVRVYVEHCRSVTPEGVTPMVEVEVPLFYQGDSHGTCDFAAMSPERVVVRDYKHGVGVLVKSFENTQLAIYALSLIRHYEDMEGFTPETVVDMAVVQPRHRDGAEQIAWEVTLAELEKFCKTIEYRATQVQAGLDRVTTKIAIDGTDVEPEQILEAAPGLVFEPGEGDHGACRWCKAKAFCKIRLSAATCEMDGPGVNPAELIAAMPDLDKEESKADAPQRIAERLNKAGLGDLACDDAYLVRVYSCWPALKAFFADLEEYFSARALDGNPAAGTKLVLGREGNRKWADEKAADKFLTGQKLKKDDRYTYKLKSPTQIEKMLKEKLAKSPRTKSRFTELVTRSEAKKVLALADDPREAVGAVVDALPDMDELDDFEL